MNLDDLVKRGDGAAETTRPQTGPNARSPEETAVESLAAQLHDLYAEKERQGDLSETVASLTAQLESLYAEREEGPSDDVLTLRAMVESFEAQLHALYDEKKTAQWTPAGVQSLVDQLEALYAEKDGDDAQSRIHQLEMTVTSLTAQLESLYEDIEKMGDRTGAELIMIVESFEAQLDALYAEREGQSPSPSTPAIPEPAPYGGAPEAPLTAVLENVVRTVEEMSRIIATQGRQIQALRDGHAPDRPANSLERMNASIRMVQSELRDIETATRWSS